MDKALLQNLYSDLQTPVVVCANTDDFPVVYMNAKASLFFSPTLSMEEIALQQTDSLEGRPLSDIVRFKSAESFGAFRQLACNLGNIDNYRSEVVTFDYTILPVYISGNCITLTQANDHFVIYLSERDDEGDNSLDPDQLGHILEAALLGGDAAASIRMVLEVAGETLNVSRSFVYEELGEDALRNTYEWCADGIQSAQASMQCVGRDVFPYDTLQESGMLVANNTDDAPPALRDLLHAQEVRSMVVLPLHGHTKGFLGFDDCVAPREWTSVEIRALRTLAALISSLLSKRDAEDSRRCTQEMVQLLLDNSDDGVYANTLEDYRLVFVNRSLAQMLGYNDPRELVGKLCWQVLQKGQDGPCSFCPIPKIALEPGADRSEMYLSEVNNELMEKSFLVKDNIIRWVDGRYVHVETAIDISTRTQYEAQLVYYATTDTMTGVKNRKWGQEHLAQVLQEAQVGSLVFIDVDGLKYTNDHYGHTSGDALLRAVVEIVQAHMAEEDFLCRWGGDEFLLYLAQEPPVAEDTLRNIQQDLDALNASGQMPFSVRFSYGITPFNAAQGAGLDALVERADSLMYAQKQKKRAKPE